MKVYWDTDCNGYPATPAAGCIVAEDGRDILIQTDWEYPSVASTFGWSTTDVQPERADPPCRHSGTDGTVDCPDCGTTAGEFIAAAADYLDEHDGAEADDPGYFD